MEKDQYRSFFCGFHKRLLKPCSLLLMLSMIAGLHLLPVSALSQPSALAARLVPISDKARLLYDLLLAFSIQVKCKYVSQEAQNKLLFVVLGSQEKFEPSLPNGFHDSLGLLVGEETERADCSSNLVRQRFEQVWQEVQRVRLQ